MTPQEERNKRFDEKFKCIQRDCDGTGHIPEQISEDEWTSSQCQFHAEYILPFKSFLQSEIDLAISDYQTNFEQKHITNSVQVAKAEERKRIVEIIKGIEKYQCADLYSQPDDDELILVSKIISIITKDK